LPPGADFTEVSIYNLTFSQWIQRGANWEDGIQMAWGEPQDIAFCHFYNPIADKGYMSPSGAEIGQSLIARSHDVTNEWSYEMAKKLYYAALIGDNSEILDNFTRMRPGWVPHLLGPLTEMTEDERDQYFAWTLQALGHTLHLIQDASVPAHTRNDFHGPLEPYERWTNKNLGHLEDDKIFTADGSVPWASWSQHPDIIAPNVFMDTNQLDASDTVPITGSDQGIAEYSYVNFMSEDTIFAYDLPAKPEELDFFYNYQSEDFNLYVRQVNGVDTTFVYLRNRRPGGVDHLALAGVLHTYHPNSSAIYYDLRWTTDDDMVNEDYATKLIPRAVGYSAGLLDYFFRGSIDIQLPSHQYHSGIYAMASPPEDGPMSTDPSEGFTRIVLDARNTTANEEAMADGSIELVVKYKRALEDPFQSEPVSSTEEYSYIVTPEANNVRAIPIDEYTELTFDLSPHLPVNATDVTLHLVYKGSLGAEADAVAVGYKDISEPTPLDVFSNLDKVCLAGGWLDAGSEAAIALVDENGNGISDYNEVDVYPHDIKDYYLRLSSVEAPQDPTGTEEDIHIPMIHAGEFMRLAYFLGDDEIALSSYSEPSPCYYPDDNHLGSQIFLDTDNFSAFRRQTYLRSEQECLSMGLSPGCSIRPYSTCNLFRGVSMHGIKVIYGESLGESWGHDTTCSLDDLE
jgi:hypothetical protein